MHNLAGMLEPGAVRRGWRSPVLISAALALLFCACREKDAGGESYEIRRDYTRGPVTFTVAVSKGEISIAERISMLLEVRSEEGFRIELPSFGDKLEQFGIVDYRNPPPRLEEGGVTVTSRLYTLEPFLSGEYRIPPMTVSFFGAGDTLRHTVESDTIKVAVRSILPGDKAGLELRDIAGPVSFPSNPYPALLIAGGAAAAVLVAYLLWRRRRKRTALVPAVPPHEVAFMRLERLLGSGMLDEKRYREFTAAVADVLRQYIEDRFGLMAPERTTEEFLEEAKTGLAVDTAHKEILEGFLVHCDLVKFAALEPSDDQVRRTFETCRDFIEATKGEEVRGEAA